MNARCSASCRRWLPKARQAAHAASAASTVAIQVGAISRAELAAIVAADGRWAAHLRLLEGTGMREDELAGWQIGDIDWRRRRVRVRRDQTKGGTHDERWIPLLADLVVLLEAILPPLEDRDPLDPILPHFPARQLWGGLGSACKRVEWEKRLTVFFRPLDAEPGATTARPAAAMECVVSASPVAFCARAAARCTRSSCADTQSFSVPISPMIPGLTPGDPGAPSRIS